MAPDTIPTVAQYNQKRAQRLAAGIPGAVLDQAMGPVGARRTPRETAEDLKAWCKGLPKA